MVEGFELPTDDFIEHLKLTGKVQAAETYGFLLISFQRWLRDKKHITIREATTSIVDEYISTIESQSTVLSAIREYFKYRYTSLPVGDPRVNDEMQRYNQLALIRPKRKRKYLTKIALTSADLSKFFKMLRDSGATDELISGFVVLFYFGARPGEISKYLATAKVSLQKREMLILTEKTLVERYLAWSPVIDPYMKTWYEFVREKGDAGLPYPGGWLTKNLKIQVGKARVISGVAVTSRTARRTFQTEMRLLNVPDITIRAVLGHTDTSMSDVYTDWTRFAPIVKEALVNNHYMIKNGVI
jgi:integrase